MLMDLSQSLLAAVPAKSLDIYILHFILLWEVTALEKSNGAVRWLTLWHKPGFQAAKGGWKRVVMSVPLM